MKKPVLLYFLFAVFTLPAIAQKKTTLGTSDPQAKIILDKAAKNYSSYNSLKAGFTLEVTTTASQSVSNQKGTIWLKGNKFKFEVGPQTVYCDGKTLWTYNKDNKEVQITNYNPQEGEITPSSLFTNFYDKNFLYRLEGTTKTKGEDSYIIDLTPLDKSKPYYKILARVSKEKDRLMRMEVFAQGGYRYTYSVDSYQPNVALNDSDFIFSKEKYPGVDVVDLRM